ncbi:MAG TPA: Asp-tRNA(Asn)/Glu-tRNA(Gln) amidotransferase subunit GatC [Candidatus Saccharimonadales bacterium]
MADLTREDVLKLARLARLTITDEEAEKYRNELSKILEYFEQLQSVDVDGLEPTSQTTGLKNVMREDKVIDYGVTPDDLLRIAPKAEDRHVKVKRMIG